MEIGNILIAEPFLQGKYFSRSVIFMVEHDEKGSIGFVLNKPMAYTTSDLVTELAGLEYPVYIGGPVEQNQLYYLHNHAEVEDALQIVPASVSVPSSGNCTNSFFSTTCNLYYCASFFSLSPVSLYTVQSDIGSASSDK